MNTRIPLLALSGLLTAANTHAQFSMADVQYWTGAGSDSSVLVIDFLDGSFNGSSYAWGYLHDGSATAEAMLAAIDAADINLQIGIAGGFVNDIAFIAHTGVGGAPAYWGSWTGTGIGDMALNGGATEPLSNGEWFGCSYTDFDPALAPGEPMAAFDPFAFSLDDVTFWVGTGNDSALLVIDFQDGSATDSYAWGYRFNGTTTGEEMLNAIAAADPALEVGFGAFLDDITYHEHAGLAGEPDYWSTWSATNTGDWEGNLGTSTEVLPGGFFGCSYTDFAPALRPDHPVPAENATSVLEREALPLQVFPQPATDLLQLNTGSEPLTIDVFDITGKRMANLPAGMGLRSMDVSAWPAGLYLVQAGDLKRTIVVQ